MATSNDDPTGLPRHLEQLMARPKSNGSFAKLAANYYLDDAILEAGEQAEVLWTRILAFLSTTSSDGFITERQIRVVGVSLRALPKRVDALRNVGLLEQVDGGFVARSWLKWNKSAAEVGRDQARDRERKARKQAEDTPNSERNPVGIQTDSSDKIREEEDKRKITTPPSPRKRGGRLPEDWTPSPELIEQMRAECPNVDLQAEHRIFTDYWIAQPGQKGVKADWDATWRNWIRRKQQSATPQHRQLAAQADPNAWMQV